VPDEVARDYLQKAQTALRHARECLGVADYSTSVSRSAECVELSLKCAIRLVGRTPSRSHDLRDDLKAAFTQLPPWFQEKVPRFALLSRLTSELRLFAIYGYEEYNAPPRALFSRGEAAAYVDAAGDVLNGCFRLQAEQGR
jgi:HEPN domain-containing protein